MMETFKLLVDFGSISAIFTIIITKCLAFFMPSSNSEVVTNPILL